jgi:hypothetical protein
MKMTITFDPRGIPVDHLHTAIALLGATTEEPTTEEPTLEVAAPEQPTPEEPARLQLQVGRSYRTSAGLRAEVVCQNSEDSFSANLYGARSRPEPLDLFYRADGRCYGPVPAWDLVEELTTTPTPEPEPATNSHAYRPLKEGERILEGDVFEHDGTRKPTAWAGDIYCRCWDNYSGGHAPHFRRIDQTPAGFPEGLLDKLPPLPEPPTGMRWVYAGNGTIHNEQRDNIYTVLTPHSRRAGRWGESESLSFHSDSLHYAVAETAPDAAP